MAPHKLSALPPQAQAATPRSLCLHIPPQLPTNSPALPRYQTHCNHTTKTLHHHITLKTHNALPHTTIHYHITRSHANFIPQWGITALPYTSMFYDCTLPYMLARYHTTWYDNCNVTLSHPHTDTTKHYINHTLLAHQTPRQYLQVLDSTTLLLYTD